MVSPKQMLLGALMALSALAAPVADDSAANTASDLNARNVNNASSFTARSGARYLMRVTSQATTSFLIGNNEVQRIWDLLFDAIQDAYYGHGNNMGTGAQLVDGEGSTVEANVLMGSGLTLGSLPIGDWEDLCNAATEFWSNEEVPTDWKVDVFRNGGGFSVASLDISDFVGA